MSSEQLSGKQSTRVSRWIVLGFLIASLVGFFDATYLAVKHYSGSPVSCSIIQGCDKVLASRYAVLYGVPVALFGSIYYITIFILTAAFIDTKRRAILSYAARFTVIGFLAALWFLYLQVFVIRAICLYCIVSAVSSVALFIFGLRVLRSTVDKSVGKIN